MTEDEMVGWHYQLNGHEFEQTPGDSEASQSLACCSPWGHKESAMTEGLNNNKSVAGFERTDSNFERNFIADKILSYIIACYR